MSIIPKSAKFKQAVAIFEAAVNNVYSNTDSIEGKGSTIKIGSFADWTEANTFAQGKGVFGTPAEVKLETMEVIVPMFLCHLTEQSFTWDWDKAKVIDKSSPLNPIDPKKKREEILKKLSPEEQEFLGLK